MNAHGSDSILTEFGPSDPYFDEAIVFRPLDQGNPSLTYNEEWEQIFSDKADFALRNLVLDALFFKEFENRHEQLRTLRGKPTLNMFEVYEAEGKFENDLRHQAISLWNERADRTEEAYCEIQHQLLSSLFESYGKHLYHLSILDQDRAAVWKRTREVCGELRAFCSRVSHLKVNAHAFMDAELPDSPTAPGFFQVYRRLVDRMVESGELNEREQAYHEQLEAKTRLYQDRRDFRPLTMMTRGTQAEEIPDDALFGNTRRDFSHDRLVKNYYNRLVEIGDLYRHRYEQGQVAPDTFLRSQAFVINTSQEFDALERAVADGRTGANFTNDTQALERRHSAATGYLTVLALTPEEKASGIGLDALERLTATQDADCIFTLLYVANLLLPAVPQPGYAGGWVDLDDVMDKIGWDARTTKMRAEMREKIWQYLVFGARAQVIGRRSIDYRDSRTGQIIPTDITTPLWAFMGQQRAMQPGLVPRLDVPVRQELVLSREWQALMSRPETHQYLPLGELLGAIPGNQPSGAWARTVGLSLASLWRRKPREALAGTLRPTRSELLTRFSPKKAKPEDVLRSGNPAHAIEYWHGCLRELVEVKFLAEEGEAARTLKDMRSSLPRRNWQSDWFKGTVHLLPGPKMAEQVKVCAQNSPLPAQRHLPVQQRKERQR